MSLKVLSGLDQVRASFRMLDTGLQQRLKGAVRETTEEIRAGAMARVPVSGPDSRKAKNRPGPGELRNTIRAEYSGEGFTGFVKAGYGKLLRSSRASAPTTAGQARRQRKLRAKARKRSLASQRLGAYAMVVEYGSPREGKEPQPFMRPAREAAVPRHRARLEKAIDGAVQAAGGDA